STGRRRSAAVQAHLTGLVDVRDPQHGDGAAEASAVEAVRLELGDHGADVDQAAIQAVDRGRGGMLGAGVDAGVIGPPLWPSGGFPPLGGFLCSDVSRTTHILSYTCLPVNPFIFSGVPICAMMTLEVMLHGG